jgi:uncharacterized protein (TIGR03086 family)
MPVLRGGTAMLERAISYALGQLQTVTPGVLPCPTPCRDWDLGTLLAHMNDSLAALQEAMDLGNVGVEAGARAALVPARRDDPAAAVRGRATRLLGSLAGRHEPLVSVGGYPVPAGIVTSAGAVDIAVHGWDVARACGSGGPIPAPLAAEILEVSRLLVTAADRPARFGAPVRVLPQASVSDQLVAYLGRDPG